MSKQRSEHRASRCPSCVDLSVTVEAKTKENETADTETELGIGDQGSLPR